MKRIVRAWALALMCLALALPAVAEETRVLTDAAGREVEIPAQVERVVCTGVGALRYTCYVGAQELVVGVEQYETEPSLERLYSYVNRDRFAGLPAIGANGEPDAEAILAADPQVIVMSAYVDGADDLQARTGVPVVVVPGSDTTLDDGAFETIRLLGELYGVEDRAAELTDYLREVEADLAARTADIPAEEKPSVYVCGVSFQGAHGFEGTEAHYGPLELIGADNLANQTGQASAFDIDPEQVLAWDPDVILIDYNGLPLIAEDYAADPDFYNALTAVREGRVYAQISFRSYASNLETALADAYYAGTVIYPERFADIDIAQKADEIFTMLLGEAVYADLVENGYAFQAVKLGA